MNHDDRRQERLLQLQAEGMIPMTADEILAGKTQAGVPRPAFLKDDDNEGTVHRVQRGAVA